MHKKILIGLLLMTVLLTFTTCYANDESNTAQNMMNNAQNTVEDAANDAGRTVQDSTQKAGNAMQNGVENVKNVASDAGRAIQNGAENVKNTIQNTMNGNNNNAESTDYTATRTAGEGTFMGMTSNTWSWLILGIAAIAIIALVWYYSAQLNNTRRHDDND